MINIQNTNDNECSKCWLVRYLSPANHHPARIKKTDKEIAKRLDFKDIKNRHIQKTEKQNFIGINVFGYENKEK